MASTFICHHYHIVFSTKGRRNLIPQDDLGNFHGYLAGIVNNVGGHAVEIGGPMTHVHLLISMPATLAVAEAVNRIKSSSSKWAKQNPRMDGFAWQEGYGSFTVSKSAVPAVQEYIRNQMQHHGAMSFEDELVGLLEKHGIEYDPRYVFD